MTALDETGPINGLPADDAFWEDQPRDRNGRWAVKEKRLRYERLVKPEPVEKGRLVDASNGNGACIIWYPATGSNYTAVPPRTPRPQPEPTPRRRRRG